MNTLKKILLLVVISFLFPHSCFAQTAEEHFKKGDNFLAQKLIPEAIVELKKALSLLEEDQKQLKVKILVSLANTYNWKGTHKAAITACKKALEIDPDNANLHYNLGFAYREQGKRAMAEKEFELHEKLLKQEGEYFEVLERATTENIERHITLGDKFFEKGKFEEALAEYNKALDIEPRNDILNKLGQVHKQMRLTDKSKEESPKIDTFTGEKTLDEMPSLTGSDKATHETSIDELLRRGASYYDRGMIDKAIEEFREVLAIDPDDTETHYNLGNAYADKGMFDEAITSYKNAIEKKPGFINAYLNLSMLYIDMDLVDEAISLCEQAIKANPNDAFLCFHLGEAYALNQQYEEAIKAYNKAISINPMDPETQYRLAESYYATGQYDMALKHVKQAEDLGYLTDPEFMSDLQQKAGNE